MKDQHAIASLTPSAVGKDNKGEASLSTAATLPEKILGPRFQWDDTFFSNDDDIIAVFDFDYPRAGSFMFFFAWIAVLTALLFIPQVFIYNAASSRGETIRTSRVVFQSLIPWIVQWAIHVLTALVAGENLYAAHRKAIDSSMKNALPWLAENRELQFLHVAVARSCIILATEARPEYRKGTVTNHVHGSRITIPFDQISCFFRSHCNYDLRQTPMLQVVLKVRIDETVGPDHLVAPVVIIPGLRRPLEFISLISKMTKPRKFEPVDSTSNIYLPKLFSSAVDNDEETPLLWQTILRELHSKELPNQDLAVERVYRERERKRRESKKNDANTLSQDNPFSLVKNLTWSDKFFANQDDILAVFDVDYPRIKIARFLASWFVILFVPASAIFAAKAKGERVAWHKICLLMLLQCTLTLLASFLQIRLAAFILKHPPPSSTRDRNSLALTGSFGALKIFLNAAFPFPRFIDRLGLRFKHVAVTRGGIILAEENKFSNICGWFGLSPVPSRLLMIAFDQIADCHCIARPLEDYDRSIQIYCQARIILNTGPDYDTGARLVIPALKDGEIFQKLITTMKGLSPSPQGSFEPKCRLPSTRCTGKTRMIPKRLDQNALNHSSFQNASHS